jgi:hypothetical protein
MKHQKGNEALIKLSILQSISKPPSNLGEDILSNYEQPVASSSHTIPMILWRKKISLLDQVYNHMDNAQKIS